MGACPAQRRVDVVRGRRVRMLGCAAVVHRHHRPPGTVGHPSPVRVMGVQVAVDERAAVYAEQEGRLLARAVEAARDPVRVKVPHVLDRFLRVEAPPARGSARVGPRGRSPAHRAAARRTTAPSPLPPEDATPRQPCFGGRACRDLRSPVEGRGRLNNPPEPALVEGGLGLARALDLVEAVDGGDTSRTPSQSRPASSPRGIGVTTGPKKAMPVDRRSPGCRRPGRPGRSPAWCDLRELRRRIRASIASASVGRRPAAASAASTVSRPCSSLVVVEAGAERGVERSSTPRRRAVCPAAVSTTAPAPRPSRARRGSPRRARPCPR